MSYIQSAYINALLADAAYIDLGEKCHPKDLRYILIRLDAATLLEKGKMQ